MPMIQPKDFLQMAEKPSLLTASSKLISNQSSEDGDRSNFLSTDDGGDKAKAKLFADELIEIMRAF